MDIFITIFISAFLLVVGRGADVSGVTVELFTHGFVVLCAVSFCIVGLFVVLKEVAGDAEFGEDFIGGVVVVQTCTVIFGNIVRLTKVYVFVVEFIEISSSDIGNYFCAAARGGVGVGEGFVAAATFYGDSLFGKVFLESFGHMGVFLSTCPSFGGSTSVVKIVTKEAHGASFCAGVLNIGNFGETIGNGGHKEGIGASEKGAAAEKK